MDNLIKIAEASMWAEKEVPSFKSGDTITVTYKIVEGNKERLRHSDQRSWCDQNVYYSQDFRWYRCRAYFPVVLSSH